MGQTAFAGNLDFGSNSGAKGSNSPVASRPHFMRSVPCTDWRVVITEPCAPGTSGGFVLEPSSQTFDWNLRRFGRGFVHSAPLHPVGSVWGSVL